MHHPTGQPGLFCRKRPPTEAVIIPRPPMAVAWGACGDARDITQQQALLFLKVMFRCATFSGSQRTRIRKAYVHRPRCIRRYCAPCFHK